MSWPNAPRHREEQALLAYWDDVVRHHPAHPVPPADAPADLAQVVRVIQSKAASAQAKSYQDDLLQSLLATYEEDSSMTPTLSAPALPAHGARPAMSPQPRPDRRQQPPSFPIRRWGNVGLRIALILLLSFLTASGIWLFSRHHESHMLAPATATPTVQASPDVPMYRGNAARTGVFPGPELTGSPIELWKLQIGDAINSAPAVIDGVLYLGAGNAGVLAIDSLSGDILWTHASKAPVGSSPAATADLVYAVDDDGLLLALDATTGAERWSMTGMRPGNPLVLDGVVYMEDTSGAFYALDSATGTVIWIASLAAPVWKSATVADGLVYFGTKDQIVHALDASTGAEVWTYALEHPESDVTINTAAVGHGYLYVGTNNPVTSDTFGQVIALDAKTGALAWTVDAEPGTGFGLPTVGESLIYIGNNDLGVLNAVDPQTGQTRWAYTMGSGFNAAPALVEGTLYVASMDGTFVALDAGRGVEEWTMTLDSGVGTGPTVAGGVAYLGSEFGTLSAITGSGMLAARGPEGSITDTASPVASPVSPVAEEIDPERAQVVWQSGPEAKLDASIWGIAVASDGVTYVVDGDTNDIAMFGPDGAYLGRWGSPGSDPGEFRFSSQSVTAGSIGFDADRNIYVFDSVNDRIQKFGPDRTFITMWGSTGTAEGEFNVPVGVVDAVSGRVFVVEYGNNRVQVFDLDGNLLDVWGEFGSEPGQLISPVAVSVMPDGTVFIAEEGTKRIQHFTADGTFLGVLEQPGTGTGVVYGMDVDVHGNLWTASVDPPRIVVYRPDGSVLTEFDSLPGTGELGAPVSVVFAPNGDLVIVAVNGSGATYITTQQGMENRVITVDLAPDASIPATPSVGTPTT